jgi:hypothetical protein
VKPADEFFPFRKPLAWRCVVVRSQLVLFPLCLVLRDSEHKGQSNFEAVLETARAAKGSDASGYRAEFIRLAETSQAVR